MLMQGASNMGLHEVSEASALIQESVSPNANVIFGFSNDDSLGDEIRITVIAAGFDGGAPIRKPSLPILTKTPTDQIQVIDVPETDGNFAEDLKLDRAAEDDTFGGYLADRNDISPKTEAIDLPAREKVSEEGKFGDDLDIPDFLK
jgi:cell division protein FtsZ